MKKIILLLLITLSICSCKQEVTDFGIVTGIEFCNKTFSNGYRTKYEVTVSKDFNAAYGEEIKATLYTNELYVIGDTIIVTNRNNLKDKNYKQRN